MWAKMNGILRALRLRAFHTLIMSDERGEIPKQPTPGTAWTQVRVFLFAKYTHNCMTTDSGSMIHKEKNPLDNPFIAQNLYSNLQK